MYPQIVDSIFLCQIPSLKHFLQVMVLWFSQASCSRHIIFTDFLQLHAEILNSVTSITTVDGQNGFQITLFFVSQMLEIDPGKEIISLKMKMTRYREMILVN